MTRKVLTCTQHSTITLKCIFHFWKTIYRYVHITKIELYTIKTRQLFFWKNGSLAQLILEDFHKKGLTQLIDIKKLDSQNEVSE